jgi:hypothetical protein
VQLRITVAEHLPENKTPSLGHVIVGANTSGTELTHWNQMMSSLRVISLQISVFLDLCYTFLGINIFDKMYIFYNSMKRY